MFERAVEKVAADVRNLRIGDRATFHVIGDRVSTRMVGEANIEITRDKRSAEAALDMTDAITANIKDAPEKDSQTGLLFGLRWSGITCKAGGRDQVTIVSDLIESVAVDMDQQLRDGKVRLPAPDEKYLSNCKVVVYAAAMTSPGGRQYTNDEVLQILAAWRVYFQEANAREVIFETHL